MKKIGIFLTALAISGAANAGWYGLTIHSRANCLNNESVTWDKTHYWWLYTSSNHMINHRQYEHDMKTPGFEFTWRSAAVHWGEGTYIGPWEVYGNHVISYNKVIPVYLGNETVTDCSIYDGWWGVVPPTPPVTTPYNTPL